MLAFCIIFIYKLSHDFVPYDSARVTVPAPVRLLRGRGSRPGEGPVHGDLRWDAEGATGEGTEEEDATGARGWTEEKEKEEKQEEGHPKFGGLGAEKCLGLDVFGCSRCWMSK